MEFQDLLDATRIIFGPLLQLGPFMLSGLCITVLVLFWVTRDFYFALRYRQSLLVPMGTEVEHPKTLVVMVHGTWGRRTRFLQEKNRLHEKLQELLVGREPLFCRLEWSGANLIFSRRCAAAALVEQLKQRIASAPSLRSIVLIGHSHGGNVAYDAACQLIARGHCRSRAAQTQNLIPEISVAALATPFLIEQRNAVPMSQSLVSLLVLACTAVLLIPDARALVGDRLLTLGIAAGASVWHWVAIALLPALLVFFLLRTVSHRFPVLPSVPGSAPSVLAIVSPNDEAMAALGFFKLLEGIFRGTMRQMRRLILGRFMQTFFALALAVAAFAIVRMIADIGLTVMVLQACALLSGMIGSVMAILVAAVITLRVVFRFVSALILLPVLPDAIRSCLHHEVNVAPAPPGISQTLIISPSSDPVIFHSDFAETDYFDALVGWMLRQQRHRTSEVARSVTTPEVRGGKRRSKAARARE